MLFGCYVLPYFTWLFALFPLFSECQRSYLSHFYYTCLKRVLRCQHWLDGERRVAGLSRSKRFIPHTAVLGKCLNWMDDNPLIDTIALIESDDIELMETHAESF